MNYKKKHFNNKFNKIIELQSKYLITQNESIVTTRFEVRKLCTCTYI